MVTIFSAIDEGIETYRKKNLSVLFSSRREIIKVELCMAWLKTEEMFGGMGDLFPEVL